MNYKFVISEKELITIGAEVRDELSKSYDISNPKSKYYRCRGLCDIASQAIIDRVKAYADIHKITVSAGMMHGEQKHIFGRNPQTWFMEHTWVKLFDGKNTVYMDATLEQFTELYKDRYTFLPRVYISNKIFPMFLPDIEHPYFSTDSKIMKKLYQFWFNNVIYNIGTLWYKIKPKAVVDVY